MGREIKGKLNEELGTEDLDLGSGVRTDDARENVVELLLDRRSDAAALLLEQIAERWDESIGDRGGRMVRQERKRVHKAGHVAGTQLHALVEQSREDIDDLSETVPIVFVCCQLPSQESRQNRQNGHHLRARVFAKHVVELLERGGDRLQRFLHPRATDDQQILQQLVQIEIVLKHRVGDDRVGDLERVVHQRWIARGQVGQRALDERLLERVGVREAVGRHRALPVESLDERFAEKGAMLRVCRVVNALQTEQKGRQLEERAQRSRRRQREVPGRASQRDSVHLHQQFFASHVSSFRSTPQIRMPSAPSREFQGGIGGRVRKHVAAELIVGRLLGLRIAMQERTDVLDRDRLLLNRLRDEDVEDVQRADGDVETDHAVHHDFGEHVDELQGQKRVDRCVFDHSRQQIQRIARERNAVFEESLLRSRVFLQKRVAERYAKHGMNQRTTELVDEVCLAKLV